MLAADRGGAFSAIRAGSSASHFCPRIQRAPPYELPGMFGFSKKDPVAKLRKEYEACMAAAIDLQRKGDIRGFASKSEEAANIEKRLLEAEKKTT